MSSPLPAAPCVNQLRKQARELKNAVLAGDAAAKERARRHAPHLLEGPFQLTGAQLIIAREHGFASWPRLSAHIRAQTQLDEPARRQALNEAFIRTTNKKKDLVLVQELLEQGADPNGRLAGVGTTALGWAACGGHIDLMEFLLERGALPDAPANGGSTALSCAAFMGQPQAVRLLLARGADANAPQPGNYSPLHGAAYSGVDEAVRLLLGAGASVNSQTTEGHFGPYWFHLPFCSETPLHNAMAHGSQAMIQLLLDAGADASLTTRHGETPFHWAGRHQKQRSKSFMQWLRAIHP